MVFGNEMKGEGSSCDRILRLRAVEVRTGLSRTSLWRLARTGKFPAPRRLGAKAIGWLESEIEEWVASRPTVRGTSSEVSDG